MARTQQQRREETVARLLDAGIDTIVEVADPAQEEALNRAGAHYPEVTA